MGLFDSFKKKKLEDGLEKTRTGFFQSIVNTLTNSQIDDDLYNDLEEQLILADVGPACAVRLVDELRDLLQSVHVQRPPAVCFFAGSFRQSSTARAKCHPLPDFPANRVRGVEKAENPYKKCRIWCKLFEKIDAFCEDPPFHAAAVVL